MNIARHQEWQDGRGNHLQVKRVRANTVDCRDMVTKKLAEVPKVLFTGKPCGLWRKVY